jgi:ABC-type transporter lipoprotein component MlaA
MTVREVLASTLVCALAGACASNDRPPELQNTTMIGIDEHRHATSGDAYEIMQYVNDPIEGFNRGSFGFTKAVVDGFVRPVAIGWRTVFPQPVRDGIDRFAYNLAWPNRFVSLLLQGAPLRAAVDTGHFLVNTSAGLAGFLDVAGPLGIPTYKEDVGQAFGRWGFGPGFYLFLPVLGPSSGRDGLGRVFDMALSPATYLPGVGLVFTVNAFSSRVRTYDMLTASGTDLYLPVRALWAINRDIQVEDYQIPETAWAEADPDPALNSTLTRLDDSEFPARQRSGEVEGALAGKKVPYSLWLQREPAPLVFIIPGIGAHRTATNAVKLAESAWERGYSAAIVSSPFNPEFILTGLSATYPGYTPSDAADLYRALGAIRVDIEQREPGKVRSTSLMGYSLGGIAALFVSQIERQTNAPNALHFERIVAINPAVDLRYAARTFDGYFDAPLEWPAEQRFARTTDAVKKAFVIRQGDDQETAKIREHATLPFTRPGSEFLIGLSSRAATIQAIAASRQRGGEELALIPAQSETFRGPFAAEIESNTLQRYMDELAIPYFAKQEGGRRSVEQLFAAADLYSQEAGLRDDPRIAVFTSKDDFILEARDLAWLEQVFAGRITVFSEGGHLGNMFMLPVQDAFMQALGTSDRPPVASPRADLRH